MEVLERLIGAVRRCCEGFPDPRRGDNGSYAMADLGLAAFSVFFAQSPSFLAHQRQLAAGHGRSNAHTLFGMSRTPVTATSAACSTRSRPITCFPCSTMYRPPEHQALVGREVRDEMECLLAR